MMMMRRANFWCNLILGIGSATFGLVLLSQFLSAYNWPAQLFSISIALRFGFDQIQKAAQSLEISDSALIYQSVWKIVRLPWQEIGGYVLNDERFVAFDKRDRKLLLDINLRGHDYLHWPVSECTHVRKFIQHKMDEVGAARISSLSLRKKHDLQWKP